MTFRRLSEQFLEGALQSLVISKQDQGRKAVPRIGNKTIHKSKEKQNMEKEAWTLHNSTAASLPSVALSELLEVTAEVLWMPELAWYAIAHCQEECTHHLHLASNFRWLVQNKVG